MDNYGIEVKVFRDTHILAITKLKHILQNDYMIILKNTRWTIDDKLRLIFMNGIEHDIRSKYEKY